MKCGIERDPLISGVSTKLVPKIGTETLEMYR